jgi:hypothetical protein
MFEPKAKDTDINPALRKTLNSLVGNPCLRQTLNSLVGS